MNVCETLQIIITVWLDAIDEIKALTTHEFTSTDLQEFEIELQELLNTDITTKEQAHQIASRVCDISKYLGALIDKVLQ